MSQVRRALAWLKLRERPISSGVALMSFVIALLSMAVALFQALLLYTQRATPYRTAVYARQLEVAEDFVGAGYQQHIRFINLYNDCIHRLQGRVGSPDDFVALSQDFRGGAEALHIAYGATIATLPSETHAKAQEISAINEFLFDKIVAPAGDCHAFYALAQEHDAEGNVRQLYTLTGELANHIRKPMRIDRLSWPAPVRELAE